MAIRVVIVDDHKVVRDGLAAVLSSVAGIEVVDTVGTAGEAVEAVRHHRPDVVVLDLRLPDKPGTTVIGPIRECSPATRILVLTSYGEDRAILASVRAGVDGFLAKTVDSEAFAWRPCAAWPRDAPCCATRWQMRCFASSGARTRSKPRPLCAAPNPSRGGGCPRRVRRSLQPRGRRTPYIRKKQSNTT